MFGFMCTTILTAGFGYVSYLVGASIYYIYKDGFTL